MFIFLTKSNQSMIMTKINMLQQISSLPITVVVGLGNPGKQYYNTRHNIGFRIVDALAKKYGGIWESKKNMAIAEIIIHGKKIVLIKPDTFMNDSGKVIPFLQKQGIRPENILVVHDELEKPFGALTFKVSGSHRGHNGLRSIISVWGKDFARFRFGIGRPKSRTSKSVGEYVLQNFTQNSKEIEQKIDQSVSMIEQLFIKSNPVSE